MDVSVSPGTDDLNDGSALVVPYFSGDRPSDLGNVSRAHQDQLQALADGGASLDRTYETTFLPPTNGDRPVLVIGAGKSDDMSPMLTARIAAAASRYLTGLGYTGLGYIDRVFQDGRATVEALVEGAADGAYNTGALKTRDRTLRSLDHVAVITQNPRANANAAVRRGQILGEARAVARDLVNLPPNEITPAGLADRARDLGRKCGLSVNVLDENALKQQGFGAILGVAQGSSQPPRVIVLRYGDPRAATRIAFVGKGITFDSGGLSLKTAEGMMTMKADMSGGAAVIAGLLAIARLAPTDISVSGYVGATENMTGAGAMRPGDVLKSYSGETIEVLNTDAEGRLVLADVLSYAVKEGATHLVDLATLTGAARVALGGAAALATGKPSEWVDQVVAAADAGLDRCWPMPLYLEYRRQMDSEIADIKNTSGDRGGGALTAAAFLSDFHGDVPWAHLDIAGMTFSDQPVPYRAKGATGFGVGAIVSTAMSLAAK